jgi:hypothetical protein
MNIRESFREKEAEGNAGRSIDTLVETARGKSPRVAVVLVDDVDRDFYFAFVLRYRCTTGGGGGGKRAIRWFGVPCQYWYCRVCYRVARRERG